MGSMEGPPREELNREPLPQKNGPSVSDAMAILSGIERQIRQTGAVDSEPAALDAIRKELHEGTVLPEEAVARAHVLMENRQNYH
jgi:hypothetical protein